MLSFGGERASPHCLLRSRVQNLRVLEVRAKQCLCSHLCESLNFTSWQALGLWVDHRVVETSSCVASGDLVGSVSPVCMMLRRSNYLLFFPDSLVLYSDWRMVPSLLRLVLFTWARTCRDNVNIIHELLKVQTGLLGEPIDLWISSQGSLVFLQTISNRSEEVHSHGDVRPLFGISFTWRFEGVSLGCTRFGNVVTVCCSVGCNNQDVVISWEMAFYASELREEQGYGGWL